MKLRQVIENCTELLAINDQYFEATAVDDVEKSIEQTLRGRR